MKSMRRIFFLLLFLLASCSAPSLAPPAWAGVAPTPAPSAPSSVREQAAKWGIRLTTIYHPDGPLYVGDRVSIEVLLPPAFTSSEQTVRVSLGNKELGKTDFGPF